MSAANWGAGGSLAPAQWADGQGRGLRACWLHPACLDEARLLAPGTGPVADPTAVAWVSLTSEWTV